MALSKTTLLMELAESLTSEQIEEVDALDERIEASLREYYIPGGFVEIDLDELPEREVLAAISYRYLDWEIILQQFIEETVTDDPELDQDDRIGTFQLLIQ